MDYLNAIQMLQQAGIPLMAEERDETWPLIIAGGPAVYTNPAPLADIIDAFAIGEGEVIIPPLVDALWEARRAPRQEGLRILAEVPGMYVPAVENGPVGRVWLRDLDSMPATTQIYADDTEFGDRALIEIARGCGRGCRFCMAGYVYRPVREVSLDAILAVARHSLKHRDRIGLVSTAISDHSWIDQIATELRAMGALISISSMRVDPISEPLIRALVVRDAGTAEEDLLRAPSRHLASAGGRRPPGALLFSCTGRGAGLFGRPDHDTGLFEEALGPVPLGGFFCNGEIGPVGGRTHLHGFTSAFGIFRPHGPTLPPPSTEAG